jgi:hypothetical protein
MIVVGSYLVYSYLVYLSISVCATVMVARTHYGNGRVFPMVGLALSTHVGQPDG